MSTGVFHVLGKTGVGRYRAPGRAGNSPLPAQRAAARRAQVAEFAEALAEDFTVSEACVLVGIKPSTGKHYLADIRRGLGWQAI